MKIRFIKFISLISALILILIPTGINAQSNKDVQQEFYEVIDTLNLDSSEIKFIPLDEIPSGSETLEFKTMKELEEFLTELEKDIKNGNNKVENRRCEKLLIKSFKENKI